jgi:hypothetical protein
LLSVRANPNTGGQPAIDGIPNVPHDNNWVTVPIVPVVQDIYAYYSIGIDDFDITPSKSTYLKDGKVPESEQHAESRN